MLPVRPNIGGAGGGVGRPGAAGMELTGSMIGLMMAKGGGGTLSGTEEPARGLLGEPSKRSMNYSSQRFPVIELASK